MNYINKRLTEIKQNGYQIDLGELINESFENYKKIALLSGLALTIVILGLFIISIFAVANFIDLENLSQNPPIMDFATFTPTELAMYIGGISIFSMILTPFTAGLIKLSHDVETKDEVSFGTIFDCYRAGYLMDLLISSLLISLITAGITIGFQIIHLDLVGTLLTYIFGFLSCMTIPLIIFGRLSAINAIVNSWMVVSKQPFVIFVAILLAVIGSCVGLIAFCLGIFFTLPYIYSMYYSIYKNSVGFENTEAESASENEI